MSPLDRILRGASIGGAMLAAACSGSDLVLPGGAGPAAIEAVGGNGQSGRAGTALPESLVVRVTDATGRPVKDQRVEFADASGGGDLSPDAATTDADGRAGSRWVLGSAIGTQTARATVVGAPDPLAAAFTATATAGSATRLVKVSGDLQPSASSVTVAWPSRIVAS